MSQNIQTTSGLSEQDQEIIKTFKKLSKIPFIENGKIKLKMQIINF